MAKALPLDQQLCFAVYAAQHAFTQFYRPLLEPLGLTYPQYLVLLSLWQKDRQSLGEIGQQVGLDSGTLTPLLKRMEVAGWLQRSRDPADERRVLVALTEKGRAFEVEAAHFPTQIADASNVAATELAELRATLFRLRSALQLAA